MRADTTFCKSKPQHSNLQPGRAPKVSESEKLENICGCRKSPEKAEHIRNRRRKTVASSKSRTDHKNRKRQESKKFLEDPASLTYRSERIRRLFPACSRTLLPPARSANGSCGQRQAGAAEAPHEVELEGRRLFYKAVVRHKRDAKADTRQVDQEDRCCAKLNFRHEVEAGTAETGCCRKTFSSYSCGRASESGTAAALLSEPACFSQFRVYSPFAIKKA